MSTTSKAHPKADWVITVLRKDYAKGGKSAARFACYGSAKTVKEYFAEVAKRCGEKEARKCAADLAWDTDKARKGGALVRLDPPK